MLFGQKYAPKKNLHPHVCLIRHGRRFFLRRISASKIIALKLPELSTVIPNPRYKKSVPSRMSNTPRSRAAVPPPLKGQAPYEDWLRQYFYPPQSASFLQSYVRTHRIPRIKVATRFDQKKARSVLDIRKSFPAKKQSHGKTVKIRDKLSPRKKTQNKKTVETECL